MFPEELSDKNSSDESVKWSQKLIKKRDLAAEREVDRQQIELLGSKKLYDRVKMNLQNIKTQMFFVEDQYKLFKWRNDFFKNKFDLSSEYFLDSCSEQITLNFDYLTALACSTQEGNGPDPYFDVKEFWTTPRLILYDSTQLKDMNKDDLQYLMDNVNFSEAAHMVVAVFRKGPPSLLQISMKTVLLHQLPLEETPKEVQNMAKYGLYRLVDPVPDNLSEEGREIYRRLRTEFMSLWDKDEDDKDDECDHND